jgi:hypothetical protein
MSPNHRKLLFFHRLPAKIAHREIPKMSRKIRVSPAKSETVSPVARRNPINSTQLANPITFCLWLGVHRIDGG